MNIFAAPFGCTFLLFSYSCFVFVLFLFVPLSHSSSLFALSAALCCVACFALFAQRTHCARWRNGSLTIPLGSIRAASERDKHFTRLELPCLILPSVRRFNCVTHARTLLPFFRLPGLLFFLFLFPLFPLYRSRSRNLCVRAPTYFGLQLAAEKQMKIKSNSNRTKIRKVRERWRERESGQRQTGKFACLECLDMLKSSFDLLVLCHQVFFLALHSSCFACAGHENEICIWQCWRIVPGTREYCQRHFVTSEVLRVQRYNRIQTDESLREQVAGIDKRYNHFEYFSN